MAHITLSSDKNKFVTAKVTALTVV